MRKRQALGCSTPHPRGSGGSVGHFPLMNAGDMLEAYDRCGKANNRSIHVRISMHTEEITIHVAPAAAQAYRAASEQERKKIDILLSLRLQDALRPGTSLKELMGEISRKAQARGLTPEILESILHEQT